MRRILITGALAFAMSSAGFGVASAQPLAAHATSLPAAAATSATAETMTPIAGADLAMWGAAPAAVHESVRSTVSVRPAIRRLANRLFIRTSRIAMTLERDALRFVGVPYAFGGTSAEGFDCSGYVQHVFAMMGVHLPRTADAQYEVGRRVIALRKGDLVFFQTYAPGASHVGIYLGHGKFIHSSSHGVMVSHLSDAYWANSYLGAKRVVND